MAESRANPGRVAAALALIEVEQGAHVEDMLAELAPPPGKDRALAWYLALGVLRRRGQVDAALRPNLRQPLTGLDAPVRAALRVGAFERLFARTADHAAVDQAVEVAKAIGAGRASGLVNAVVRRVRMPENLSLADELDHPAWLLSRWQERYGDEETRARCAANNEAAPTYIVAPGGADGLPVQPTDVAQVFRMEAGEGAVTDLEGFDAGRFWVQDLAAVRVADLVGATEGTTVLDACAAPGGKSFRIASHGAEVTAVDADRRRLATIAAGAARVGAKLKLHRHDWLRGPSKGIEQFDAVLVDAPCTGLGTVRRHPEIRWRRQLVDVLQIAPKQSAILRAAASHVKPGGTLVYAVCSPEPEEGEAVIARFVKEHPDFTVHTELATSPADDQDAHYAAKLVRA